MHTASWRYILFLLSFLGLFASGAILWMLFWMSARIETIEHEKTHALINLKITETAEQLRLGVEDYAFWTFAHDLVTAKDNEGILENIGSGATDSELFDQLFILAADGTLQHAFDAGLGANAQALYDAKAIAPVWNTLRASEPADYQSNGSIVRYGDGHAIVVAGWITPDLIEDFPETEVSALIGVIQLNGAFLDRLITAAGLDDVAITGTVFADNGQLGHDQMTLLDFNGRAVGTLSWSMPSTGLALRQELLPGVIIMGLSILGICAAAARYFRSQHGALRQANRIATTDQLTGLLNRAGLAERLTQKSARIHLAQGHLAAIYLDLNKFKDLNDTHGHLAGDTALRVTAERLTSAMRKNDFVARIGGDEFLCVIADEAPQKAALAIANRILKLTQTPIHFENHSQAIKPSVGIATCPPGTNWETILSQSDAAMYWAKQTKADHPVVFAKDMHAVLDDSWDTGAAPA